MLGVYPSQGKAEHDTDDQVCIGRESKDVVDDKNRSSRGKDGISRHEVNRHLEGAKVLTLITTHLSRGFKRMPSISDNNKQGNGEAKVFGVLGLRQPRTMEWL